MNEEANVTEVVGERFGRIEHKRLTLEHVENGWLLTYKMPAKKLDDDDKFYRTVEHRRVFEQPLDMLDFIALYCAGKVKDV